MLRGQRQTEHGLTDPEGAFRAGILLYHGQKLSIESQTGHAMAKHVVPSDKLQQGPGADSPGPSGIQICFSQEEMCCHAGCGRVSIYIAPAPHLHFSVPIEEQGIILHELTGILLKSLRQFRLFLISIPEIPQRQIRLKGPCAVIIEGMAVPIPSVSGIKGSNGSRVSPHERLVDRIPLAM